MERKAFMIERKGLDDLVTEIPAVGIATVKYVEHRMLNEEGYGKVSVKRIMKENQNLGEFLSEYAEKYTENEFIFHMGVSIYNILKKEGKLPRLTIEAMEEVTKEYENSSGNKYIHNIVQRLREQNPCLIEFVNTLSSYSNKPEATMTAGVLTYRLLEKQAELNKLKIN